MVTVQHLVARELEKNPILVDLLAEGLLNISAVSQKILPQISRELRRDVKLSAVSMATRRFVQTLGGHTAFRWKFPQTIDLSTKSHIYEVAIEKTSDVSMILKQVSQTMKPKKGEFLSVVEGTYECMFFTNQSRKRQLRIALAGHCITSELDNLSYITLNWPKITKDVPGIYYRITRSLAFRGISIQSFHTIGSEMMIFFKDDVFLDAYRTIVGLLEDQKSF